MTSPEPLRGAVAHGRPARILGSDEVAALELAADENEPDDELDDTGEWELEDDHRPD
jgi:hypothetical protein